MLDFYLKKYFKHNFYLLEFLWKIKWSKKVIKFNNKKKINLWYQEWFFLNWFFEYYNKRFTLNHIKEKNVLFSKYNSKYHFYLFSFILFIYFFFFFKRNNFIFKINLSNKKNIILLSNNSLVLDKQLNFKNKNFLIYSPILNNFVKINNHYLNLQLIDFILLTSNKHLNKNKKIVNNNYYIYKIFNILKYYYFINLLYIKQNL